MSSEDKSVREKIEELAKSNPIEETSTEQVEVSPEKASVSEEPSVQVEEPPPTEPEQPSYQPNFKYKVYDEEREIPEMFRSLIKDETTEKQVREIFCKAGGLDGIKPKYEKVRTERDDYKTKADEYRAKATDLETKWNKFNHLITKDKEAFLDAAGFTDHELFDIAQRRLKLHEAPPEERRAYEDARSAKIQNYDLQQEHAAALQENNLLRLQQHESEMRFALSNPDIQTFKKEFDARMGEGAFNQELKNYGQLAWATSKKYVTPFEAIETVMNRYKPLISFNTQTQVPQTSQATFQSQNTQPQPRSTSAPVIPNVGSGRSTSPVLAKVKSLDDLRKIARQFDDEPLGD